MSGSGGESCYDLVLRDYSLVLGLILVSVLILVHVLILVLVRAHIRILVLTTPCRSA